MFLVTRQPLHSFFLLSSVIFANINLQIASRTRDAGVSEICLGYQARRESLGDSPEKPEKIRAARRDEIRGKRVRITEEERTPGEVREPRETLLSTRNNGTDWRVRASTARLAGPSRSRRRNAIVIGRRSAGRESPRADWFARGRELRYTYKSNRCDRERGDDNKIAPRDVGLIYEELIYAGRVNSARSGLLVRKSGGFYGCDRRFRIRLPGKRRWGSQ